MKKMYGITTAMLTPLDSDGNILEQQLKDYTEFLINRGVHCLYPLGSMGEMNLLTLDQRKKAAEIIIDTAKDRVPVFVHVGATREEDTLLLAHDALEQGADGIGIVTPSYWPFKQNEVIGYFERIAKTLPDDFPIYIYNIPQYTTIDMTTDMMKTLTTRCKNVVGMKYSVGNMARTQEYLKIKTNDFSVIQGGDLLLTLAMTLGCDGVISGYSSAFPEYFVQIWDLYKEGKLEEAKLLQNKITDIVSVLKKEVSTIPKLKTILKLRGMDIGVCHKPFLMPTEEQENQIITHLKHFEVL